MPSTKRQMPSMQAQKEEKQRFNAMVNEFLSMTQQRPAVSRSPGIKTVPVVGTAAKATKLLMTAHRLGLRPIPKKPKPKPKGGAHRSTGTADRPTLPGTVTVKIKKRK